MKVGVLSIKFIFHLKKYLFQWCSQFFLLDKLGPTVFAPVKMDLVGNIKVSILACLWRLYLEGVVAWNCIQKQMVVEFILRLKSIGQL